jgi:redox-sensitive bicupin YhaK (pirin superfamily)
MSDYRKIRKSLKSAATMEGAGVHLKRAFGYHNVPDFDPFLLLDDFRSKDPKYYSKGFPWHPHRGIETVTYVLDGYVNHEDSIGNKGIIGPGDTQWMTAGSGILHQEMPKGDDNGIMGGFQLWVNLPTAEKMSSPCYREVKSKEIPEVLLESGAKIKIICGGIEEINGPITNISVKPEFLDVYIPKNSRFIHPTKPDRNVFAYVIQGKARFDPDSENNFGNEELLLYENGNNIEINTDGNPVRFLLISGQPLNEPIAWRGPIVSNYNNSNQ